MKPIFLVTMFLIIAVSEPVLGNETAKGTISGKVVDALSNQPLEYTSLVLISAIDSSMVDGTITSTDGSFSFKKIEKGNYILEAHFIGCQTAVIEKIEIQSKKDQIDLGEIKLIVSRHVLDEAEIIAKNDDFNFKVDKMVVNVSEQINAKGGNVVDALQGVPSVQVNADGNVLLRGSANYLLLIDGRPSLLDAADALKQIPAETIQSIEIITTPSAKYQSEGNAGIINLISRKEFVKGIDGLLNLSIATGDKYSGSITVNKKRNNLRSYLSLSYSDKTKQNESTSYRETFSPTRSTENIDSKRKVTKLNAEISGGFDYTINDNNTFSVLAQVGRWSYDRYINSNYHSFTEDVNFSSFITSEEDFINQNNFAAVGVNYQHLFSENEHSITFDGYYNYQDSEISNNFSEQPTGYQQQIQNNSIRHNGQFKLDYTKSIFKNTKFESGLSTDFESSNYLYQLKGLNESLPDSALGVDSSTNYYYDQNIFAAYAVFASELKYLSLQAGLRMELTDRIITTQTVNYSLNQFNVLPSLHLTKSLKRGQTIGLGYSRRIDRPTEWQLSPYIYSINRYTITKGNPNLICSITNSLEGSYNFNKEKSSLNFVLYYRHEKNAITSILLNENDLFFETYDNLENVIDAGVEMFTKVKPTKWFELTLMLNTSYATWDGQISDGNELKGSSFLVNGYLNTTFKLYKTTSLQFITTFYGPGQIPQGYADAFYYFDFILKQSFFNSKLNLTARSHNTFDTGLYKYSATGATYQLHGEYLYEGPTFILSLSYRLNHYRNSKSNKRVKQDYDSRLDH